MKSGYCVTAEFQHFKGVESTLNFNTLKIEWKV